MPPDYLLAIFHWRDRAGDLDDQHPRASLQTLLFGCERWLELNPTASETDEGRRLLMIKCELEELLERSGRPPGAGAVPAATIAPEQNGNDQ